jgi:hypothetical protein
MLPTGIMGTADFGTALPTRAHRPKHETRTPCMASPGIRLWEWLRGQKRGELDKLEADLIMRPFERRDYAGDPAKARVFLVPTRNRKKRGH